MVILLSKGQTTACPFLASRRCLWTWEPLGEGEKLPPCLLVDELSAESRLSPVMYSQVIKTGDRDECYL